MTENPHIVSTTKTVEAFDAFVAVDTDRATFSTPYEDRAESYGCVLL